MQDAYWAALPLINAGELVQARMAFLERYREDGVSDPKKLCIFARRDSGGK